MVETLYLIRHATPDRGPGVGYNVLPGPPLTADGRREAAETARWLNNRGIEQLLASPFERARATAEAISTELALPLIFADALREGAPGEKVEQVRARMAELLAQLDDGATRCAALVTHGVCIRTLLQLTTNDRIDLSGHVYDNGNCAPTAGVWRGERGDNCWRWELAFRPAPPL
jgi:2,3-bisphosphoglycerate-dependent phosphoglycerate mutase